MGKEYIRKEKLAMRKFVKNILPILAILFGLTLLATTGSILAIDAPIEKTASQSTIANTTGSEAHTLIIGVAPRLVSGGDPAGGDAPFGPIQAAIAPGGYATGSWDWQVNWGTSDCLFDPTGTTSAVTLITAATCTYNSPGTYTITATVTREGLTDTSTNFVTVTSDGG